jgi:hypothetical protein
MRVGANMASIDTDRDGLTDNLELAVGRSAVLGVGAGPAASPLFGLDPTDPDTNDDGFVDGFFGN